MESLSEKVKRLKEELSKDYSTTENNLKIIDEIFGDKLTGKEEK